MDEQSNIAQRLQEIGVANGHAYDLANGRRSPSLKLARRIEAEMGIPMSAWPMPEKPRRTTAEAGAEAA